MNEDCQVKDFDELDDFAPQDAIVRELGAFVTEFRAWSEKGKIKIKTGQPDVLTPANVLAVALIEVRSWPRVARNAVIPACAGVTISGPSSAHA